MRATMLRTKTSSMTTSITSTSVKVRIKQREAKTTFGPARPSLL